MNAYIAVPAYRGLIFQEFVDFLNGTMSNLHKYGVSTMYQKYTGCCFIALTRSLIVRDFLNTKGDVLVFLDDDLTCGVSDLAAMLALDLDIVGGAYRQKKEDVAFCVVPQYVGENKDILLTDKFNGCIKASRLPTGFMAIKRTALEKMVAHYGPTRTFHDCSFGNADSGAVVDLFPNGIHTDATGETIYESDDTAFCRMAEEIGIDMWIKPDINFKHWDMDGKYYRGNFAEYLRDVTTPIEKAAA